ncbi:hypothetical protein FRC03_006736 [Tulasnella sp. 419]|nr:hypothetical protein FRC02_000039 [Tulasnella sp. 418]KAG8968615.1 hypothetical protein FRC03_006736 [Tulasnella sp. 419]
MLADMRSLNQQKASRLTVLNVTAVAPAIILMIVETQAEEWVVRLHAGNTCASLRSYRMPEELQGFVILALLRLAGRVRLQPPSNRNKELTSGLEHFTVFLGGVYTDNRTLHQSISTSSNKVSS